MTRGDPVSYIQPAQDTGRRAVYQALIDGARAHGPRASITFCVYTLDLDEGRGDVYVAAGLGLALAERGHGVRLVERSQWHRLEPTDVVVAMLPTFEPADAGDAWTVAWVRNETDRWVRQAHLPAYDQVLASSELAARRLRLAVPRVEGVLPIGVDTHLFTPPPDDSGRTDTAVTTAHFWGSIRDAHRALMDLPGDADVAMFGHAGNAPAELLRWHRPAVPYFSIPEIYRRARIVIDDMNWTTVGYGSLNSRFFEAAACGALPLVNGSLGTIALGFDDIPRYRDSAELAQCLRELRAEPAATASLAGQVSEQVRTGHSWEVRAGQFEQLLAAGRDATWVTPPPKKPLHHFPGHDDPYQRMLYSGLGQVGAHPVPIGDLPVHLGRRAQADNPGVVHLHSVASILQPADGPYRARQVLDAVAARLRAFKAAGGRLVWTVNDLIAQDPRHRLAEIELAQLLSAEADIIHVLSDATLDTVDGLAALDHAQVAVIEHASCLGQYPHWISRDAARARLGILPQEKVLIAIGDVRRCQALHRLIAIFENLAQHDPSLRLLVSARASEHLDSSSIREACERSPRISLVDHLPDDHLQVWLGAADLAVLLDPAAPDSWAYALAQTFGLPILGPREGASLPDEVQPHVRWFTPGDDSELAAALRSAIHDAIADPEEAAKARASAVAAAERFTAVDMGAKFAALIEPLLFC